MNNSRRNFIKKSLFCGILGVFAPNLIGKVINNKENPPDLDFKKEYPCVFGETYIFDEFKYVSFDDGGWYYEFLNNDKKFKGYYFYSVLEKKYLWITKYGTFLVNGFSFIRLNIKEIKVEFRYE